jgi:hypothetical protein
MNIEVCTKASSSSILRELTYHEPVSPDLVSLEPDSPDHVSPELASPDPVSPEPDSHKPAERTEWIERLAASLFHKY